MRLVAGAGGWAVRKLEGERSSSSASTLAKLRHVGHTDDDVRPSHDEQRRSTLPSPPCDDAWVPRLQIAYILLSGSDVISRQAQRPQPLF